MSSGEEEMSMSGGHVRGRCPLVMGADVPSHGDVPWEGSVEGVGGGELLVSAHGDIKEGQNGPSGHGHSQVKT